MDWGKVWIASDSPEKIVAAKGVYFWVNLAVKVYRLG